MRATVGFISSALNYITCSRPFLVTWVHGLHAHLVYRASIENMKRCAHEIDRLDSCPFLGARLVAYDRNRIGNPLNERMVTLVDFCISPSQHTDMEAYLFER